MSDGVWDESIDKKAVDFSKGSDDYAKSRPGFPDPFYERLESDLSKRFGSKPSLNILDLGSGPGIISLALCDRPFFEHCRIIGIDISEAQIENAKKLARKRGLSESRVSFEVGKAEDVDKSAMILQLSKDSMMVISEDASAMIEEGKKSEMDVLKEGPIDLIICGQCFPWFDPARALPAMRKVLKSDGILNIAHYCYLPRESIIAKMTEVIILKDIDPEWPHSQGNGLYPSQIDILSMYPKLFAFQDLFTLDYPQRFTVDSWLARVRTCNALHRASDEQISQFEDKVRKVLNETGLILSESDSTFVVKHRVWSVTATAVDLERYHKSEEYALAQKLAAFLQ